MGLAKLIKDKHSDNHFRSRYTTPNWWSPSPTITSPTTILMPRLKPTPTSGILPTPVKPNPTLPFTRLSPDAMQQRRALSLCFRCPEKYHLGHKCSPPQLLIIVDNEDDLIDDTTEQNFQSTNTIPMTDPANTEVSPQFLSLSLVALLGASSPWALRVTCYVDGHPVTV